jgi:D-alanyl-lipoteichoic acid acyltransferase DltB (MBOAT superfamily)
MVGLSFLQKKTSMRNLFLFAASIFFYWKTSAAFVFLLLFSTVADWGIGLLMNGCSSWKRKSLLILSIVLNLGFLAFFKYAYFFADASAELFGTTWEAVIPGAQWMNSNLGTSFRVSEILLPVGISFYTFQTLSYTIDLYKRKIEPVKSLSDFGCYVTFFPQLVAGPIVRAVEFIPQLSEPYNLTRKEFKHAIWWILAGLSKKIIFADYIATNLVDRVFANPTSHSGMEVLLGLYGYSLQVFADFSGYSDIAIGVALLMGFRLPINFRSPYKARNVGEFWQRWHISLSTWLRDYLYIPMGGNRNASFFTRVFSISLVIISAGLLQSIGVLLIGIGILLMIWSGAVMFPNWGNKVATYINIFATMLIGGLWHGASWNFLLWGALNGLGLMTFKLLRDYLPWAKLGNWWARAIGVLLTFNFITFTRIWFRSGSGTGWETVPGNHNILTEWFTANDLVYQLTSHFNDIPFQEVMRGHAACIGVMALGYLVHLCPERLSKKIIDGFTSIHSIGLWVITCLVAIVLWKVGASAPQPFIYFQF